MFPGEIGLEQIGDLTSDANYKKNLEKWRRLYSKEAH